jgi:tetratricopeptide (TPR) repeat protein
VFITPFIQKSRVADPAKPTYDKRSSKLLFDRAIRYLEEYGIESLGLEPLERYHEAIEGLKYVIRNYPESEEADDVLYHLGRIYFEDLQDYRSASQYWNQLVVGYPDSPHVTRDFKARLRAAEKKAEQRANRIEININK